MGSGDRVANAIGAVSDQGGATSSRMKVDAGDIPRTGKRPNSAAGTFVLGPRISATSRSIHAFAILALIPSARRASPPRAPRRQTRRAATSPRCRRPSTPPGASRRIRHRIASCVDGAIRARGPRRRPRLRVRQSLALQERRPRHRRLRRPLGPCRRRPHRRADETCDNAGHTDAVPRRSTSRAASSAARSRACDGTDYTFPTTAEVDYYMSKGMNTFRVGFKWERCRPPRTARSTPRTSRASTRSSRTRPARARTSILNPHNFARYYGNTVGSAQVPNAVFADFWSRLGDASRGRIRTSCSTS